MMHLQLQPFPQNFFKKCRNIERETNSIQVGTNCDVSHKLFKNSIFSSYVYQSDKEMIFKQNEPFTTKQDNKLIHESMFEDFLTNQ